ncbi:hypothetical protein G6030_05925 [Dietzia sp. E1]|uniref:pilus assembly protein TadG-related protein n=1 Tax=Dietzia sp. E1 TaxID=328361 RepID=UPI0015F7A0DA|nr:pilus assembly protein TadG-related protein [Dietzia sp. E1]MBB1020823.1 hypothetical protein [Dietzia sp. E1]
MLRIGDDRGAVGVLVAILMVPLIGFAALSLDIAATYSAKQQLQTGADAAALAIAQDCARNACGSPTATAQEFADLNSPSDDVVARVDTIPTAASGRVTVTVETERQHWFAPVLGVDSTTVTTTASAGWGSPTGGTAMLPLIFSLCELEAQAGNALVTGNAERTILSTKTSQTGCFKNDLPVPGGFGWLETDSGQTCQSTTRVGAIVYGEPGNTPKRCDLSTIRNKTVLLPVFDGGLDVGFGGNGRGAWYKVHGYVAFRVTGYNFSGQRWNPPCSGNDRCIRGYFTSLSVPDPSFVYGPGAPGLGTSAVHLLPD